MALNPGSLICSVGVIRTSQFGAHAGLGRRHTAPGTGGEPVKARPSQTILGPSASPFVVPSVGFGCEGERASCLCKQKEKEEDSWGPLPVHQAAPLADRPKDQQIPERERPLLKVTQCGPGGAGPGTQVSQHGWSYLMFFLWGQICGSGPVVSGLQGASEV